MRWIAAAVVVSASIATAIALAQPTDAGTSPVSSSSSLPSSQVLEAKVQSQALGQEVRYVVYIPPGYSSDLDRRYPVLYMLHSLGGDRHQWQRQGLFASADLMIRSGEIQPMIIVSPDGENSYWLDHAQGGPRWGTFVSRELVVEVDKTYRTLPGREYRAIGGASMGAHGALQLAMTSNVFGVVGAHSIALRRFEERFPFFGDRGYFEAHDPVTLCLRNKARVLDTVMSIDIGENDPWLPAAKAFHEQLLSAGVLHFWQVNPGGHDAQYWGSHVVEYLEFYGRALALPVEDSTTAVSGAR